jgi:hypothetical protein
MAVIVAPKKPGFLGQALGAASMIAPFIPGGAAFAPFLGAGAALANGNPMGAAGALGGAAAGQIFGQQGPTQPPAQAAPAPQTAQQAAVANSPVYLPQQVAQNSGQQDPLNILSPFLSTILRR